jgi:hypothetical protein
MRLLLNLLLCFITISCSAQKITPPKIATLTDAVVTQMHSDVVTLQQHGKTYEVSNVTDKDGIGFEKERKYYVIVRLEDGANSYVRKGTVLFKNTSADQNRIDILKGYMQTRESLKQYEKD